MSEFLDLPEEATANIDERIATAQMELSNAKANTVIQALPLLKPINPNITIIKDKIETLKKKKGLFEKNLLVAIENYENGMFTLQEFKEIKQKYEFEIDEINNKIGVLGDEREQYSTESLKNSYNMIENFETQIQGNSLSNEQKNQLYRSIIDCIVWTRQENNISIEIRFK